MRLEDTAQEEAQSIVVVQCLGVLQLVGVQRVVLGQRMRIQGQVRQVRVQHVRLEHITQRRAIQHVRIVVQVIIVLAEHIVHHVQVGHMGQRRI